VPLECAFCVNVVDLVCAGRHAGAPRGAVGRGDVTVARDPSDHWALRVSCVWWPDHFERVCVDPNDTPAAVADRVREWALACKAAHFEAKAREADGRAQSSLLTMLKVMADRFEAGCDGPVVVKAPVTGFDNSGGFDVPRYMPPATRIVLGNGSVSVPGRASRLFGLFAQGQSPPVAYVVFTVPGHATREAIGAP
jgi:hypothetical protein